MQIRSIIGMGRGVPSGGQTFLINEDFEGTGTPTGWGGSVVDFDSTVSPLQGAQSCRISDTGQAFTPSGLAQAEIYVKYQVRVSALPASNSLLTEIRRADSQYVLKLFLLSSGIFQIQDAAGFAQTVSTVSATTIYDVEIHYKAGGGSDAIGSVGFVTTGGTIPTSGNAFAGYTNGSSVDNVDRVVWNSASITTDIDTVKISTTFI